MPIGTRNRAVLKVPKFSANLEVIYYDHSPIVEEMKCFFSVSASDRQLDDDTIVVSFYDKQDFVLYEVKAEMPEEWNLQTYLKVLYQFIISNNNSVTVMASKTDGKNELGEIIDLFSFYSFNSERVKRQTRKLSIDSYFSGCV